MHGHETSHQQSLNRRKEVMRIGDENLFEIGCRESQPHTKLGISSHLHSQAWNAPQSGTSTQSPRGLASTTQSEYPTIVSSAQDVLWYPLKTRSWTNTLLSMAQMRRGEHGAGEVRYKKLTCEESTRTTSETCSQSSIACVEWKVHNSTLCALFRLHVRRFRRC